MDENTDIIEYIKEHKDGFSKRQKAIAEYILNNYEKAAYMTAAKLAKNTGVSESTVVRFAAELGYDGYQQFQKSLLDVAKMQLTNIQRMELISDIITPENVLETVLKAEMQGIERTLAELDRNEFNNTVNTLLNAGKIFIIGVRSSSALSGFAYIYFNMLFDNVRLISSNLTGDVFSQIIHANKGDAVLAISFPRYSKSTYNAVKLAKSRGASVIALTDTLSAPIVSEADTVLITGNAKIDSFADSLVAPMCVLNALICALGMRRRHDIKGLFEAQEKILNEFDEFSY